MIDEYVDKIHAACYPKNQNSKLSSVLSKVCEYLKYAEGSNKEIIRGGTRKHVPYQHKKPDGTLDAWTIGYGHNMDTDKGFSADYDDWQVYHYQLTEMEAEYLLRVDTTKAITTANKTFGAILAQNYDIDPFNTRFDKNIALGLMVFNMGIGSVRKFKNMEAAIIKGDTEQTINEMKDSKWYRNLPERAEMVMRLYGKTEQI